MNSTIAVDVADALAELLAEATAGHVAEFSDGDGDFLLMKRSTLERLLVQTAARLHQPGRPSALTFEQLLALGRAMAPAVHVGRGGIRVQRDENGAIVGAIPSEQE